MQDQLLEYYQQELFYLRQEYQLFAKEHPKIAARLRLNAATGQSDDPAFERLLQSIALQNAKMLYTLEDDSELVHPLLYRLAPHFLSPIPALSVAQFTPNTTSLRSSVTLPKNTLLKLATLDGIDLHFTTIYPVTLWPILITHAQLHAPPFKKSWRLMNTINDTFQPPAESAIKAILSITLTLPATALAWSELKLDQLRFYISAPHEYRYKLYELILKNTLLVGIVNAPANQPVTYLDVNPIKPVGFRDDEYLLPYEALKPGQCILFDYAALPEKFLFFDMTDLKQAMSQFSNPTQPELTLLFYLKTLEQSLLPRIKTNDFALHCTPIINLFKETVHFSGVNGPGEDYPLSSYYKPHDQCIEIYRINQLSARQADTTTVEIPEYFLHAGKSMPEKHIYYQTHRVPEWLAGQYPAKRSELLLRFIDQQGAPLDTTHWTITAEVLCTNSYLPATLDYSNPANALTLAAGHQEHLAAIQFMQSMSLTRYPFFAKQACLGYLSHLFTNPLLFLNTQDNLLPLQEVLKIYDFNPTANISGVDSIQSVGWEKALTINPIKSQGSPVLWHGVKITLIVDPSAMPHGSLWLWGCVLERFLATYTTSNFFTQLQLSPITGAVDEWPERRGEQELL